MQFAQNMFTKYSAMKYAMPLLTIIFYSLVCQNPASSQSFVFINANVIDGISDEIMNNTNVLISDGKIAAISIPLKNIPENSKVIDLQGKYLVPGLIDAHVHLRSLEAAETALKSGVTTARNMGGPHFIDVGMKELSTHPSFDIPEVLAAGYHVRPKPDKGFYTDLPLLARYFTQPVKGKEAVIEMTQAMIDKGVDWVKVNATARAGLPHTDPRQPYYNVEEMTAIVETAAANGIPVAAHAHGDEGGRAAVLGGVKSIEHGTYLSDETLQLMLERGTYLVPTIAVVTDLTMPGGDYDDPLLEMRGRHMLPRIREMAKRAYQMGIVLVASTDTGYRPNSTLRLAQELEEFQNLGMSNMEIIKAATSFPPICLK